MTRIFDALKKAATGGPIPARSSPAAVPPPHVAPAAIVPPPHVAPAAIVPPSIRPLAPRSEPGRRAGYAFAGGLPVSDDIVRELTTLRVAIEAALPDRACRRLMFTSPQGREGTSTVTLQFLEVLARDPATRPAFVDANVRRPALEVDATARIARLGPALRRGGGDPAVLTPNVSALVPPDEARRLGVFSPALFRELLDAVHEDFDWVLVDGPPVLDSPDAASLAGVVDGVVLVLEAGRTKRPVLVRSADLVRSAGARLLGSVLNRRRHEIPEFIYRRI